MIRESFLFFFVLAVGALFTLCGVVTAPLFSTSPDFGGSLSRFVVAWPLIILFIALITVMAIYIRKIAKERDQKQKETIETALNTTLKTTLKENNIILAEALKEAFKEALRETGLVKEIKDEQSRIKQ